MLNNIDKFKGFETYINRLNTLRTTVALFALMSIVGKSMDIKISWDSLLEWYAFLSTFVAYMLLANIIKYTDVFVFEKQN